MKRVGLLFNHWFLFILFCSIACEREDLSPPEIALNRTSIQLGLQAIVSEDFRYRFTLQIRNIGEKTLKISNVRLRGDANCAFSFVGPDIKEVTANGSAFVRVFFAPVSRGDYQVAVEINSNSETQKKLVVPICATALPAEEIDESSVDLTAICTAPPAGQPDCVPVETDTEQGTDLGTDL